MADYLEETTVKSVGTSSTRRCRLTRYGVAIKRLYIVFGHGHAFHELAHAFSALERFPIPGNRGRRPVESRHIRHTRRRVVRLVVQTLERVRSTRRDFNAGRAVVRGVDMDITGGLTLPWLR